MYIIIFDDQLEPLSKETATFKSAIYRRSNKESLGIRINLKTNNWSLLYSGLSKRANFFFKVRYKCNVLQHSSFN